MDCEQLIRLVKEWGLQVKQETMAIARMKLFVDQHIKKCPVCAKDLIMPDELEKIYEYLVPGSGKSLLVPVPEEPAGDVDADEGEPQDGEEEEEFVGDEDEDEAEPDDLDAEDDEV